MRKTTILILIFILHSFSVISQGNFGKSTPQVADFIKYGEIPVSLFHGQMSLEVPIYHYKDRDFDIPIKLVYRAEGFKPSKRSDLVGLDWTLIAGGCITREIYGAPDDSRPYSQGEYGYYLTVKDGGYDKNKIWEFKDPPVKRCGDHYCLKLKDDVHFVDYQPDLFLFNFNGHSGHFMIDDNGAPLSTNRAYRIDISNLKEQLLESNNLNTESSIKIITPEGYTYEFGGDGSKLEYSINFKDLAQPEQGDAHPTILAWHLSKITAPNGRVVTFNYVEHEDDLLRPEHPLWQSSETKIVKNGLTPSISRVGTATKKSVLASIEIEKVKIEFNSSIEETLGNNNNNNNGFFINHTYYNGAIYQLDNISVKYNDNLEFTYNLSYENSNRRRFLKEVILNDNSKYRFTYKHAAYPIPGQGGNPNQDAFGFWNQNDGLVGLMSQVHYPTGGYSDFLYEKHEYSKKVVFDAKKMEKYLVDPNNMVNDTTNNGNGNDNGNGEVIIVMPEPTDPPICNTPPTYNVSPKNSNNGSRISKVIHYTATNQKAFEKTYIYKAELQGDKSSGILYQSLPIINLKSGGEIYALTDIWLKNYNIDEPAIGYSDVLELYPDSSYCKYSFTDWNDYPDNMGDKIVKFKYIDENYTPTESDNLFLIHTGHSRIASNSDQRGKLKDKFYYAPGSTTAELTEHFDYLNMISYYGGGGEEFIHVDSVEVTPSKSETPREHVVAFLSMEKGGMAKKIYLNKYHPVTRHDIINKDGVRTLYETSYNDYDLPKTENTIMEFEDPMVVYEDDMTNFGDTL